MNTITGNGYQLIEGDCVQVMAGMPDSHIDMVCTSPPYDNLRDYGKGFAADSFDWRPIIKELYRVTAVGGVVVWVVADATINGSETGTSFKQALWAMECGFRLHDTMIYRMRKQPMNNKRYEQGFEYMFVFSNGAPKTFNGIQTKRKYKDNRKRKVVNRKKNGDFDYGFAGQSPTVLTDNVWRYNTGGGAFIKRQIRGNTPRNFSRSTSKRSHNIMV